MSDATFAAHAALPHNKQVLFDALTAAGIVVVTIAFDGSGDSGQFEQPVGAEGRVA